MKELKDVIIQEDLVKEVLVKEKIVSGGNSVHFDNSNVNVNTNSSTTANGNAPIQSPSPNMNRPVRDMFGYETPRVPNNSTFPEAPNPVLDPYYKTRSFYNDFGIADKDRFIDQFTRNITVKVS
jgi:hypothetical protein